MNRIFKHAGISLSVFIILSLLLYFPTLNRSFVSDDYLVLRRVTLDKILLMKGFFRPLSDITIYINFLIGGYNPLGYYLFAVILHGLNSFLLFIFCRSWKWTEDSLRQNKYALLAAFLFLCYPFHNESIVWLLGRASSMASTFGILSLVILVSNLSERRQLAFVCIFYFIGLTAYESILLLPVMVLIVRYEHNRFIKKNASWICWMGITLLFHLVIRVISSGVLAGSYGESFFVTQPLHYLVNIFKVTGRYLIPPVQETRSFSILVIAFILILSFVFWKLWHQTTNRIYFIKLLGLTIVASVTPVLFSVSTKTSESDRFLHLPSFFVCGLIAFALTNLVNNYRRLLVYSTAICIYFIFFLEENNTHWIRASNISETIIRRIKENSQYSGIWLVNLPDEQDGAYIFRLGLKDALVIRGINETRINIVNHLTRDQERVPPDIIVPRYDEREIILAPNTVIRADLKDVARSEDGTLQYVYPKQTDVVLYWDKQDLRQLDMQPLK